MKFSMISQRAASGRRSERFWMWLAWAVPRELSKWCAVRVMANASCCDRLGHLTPSEVTILDVLDAWHEADKKR